VFGPAARAKGCGERLQTTLQKNKGERNFNERINGKPIFHPFGLRLKKSGKPLDLRLGAKHGYG